MDERDSLQLQLAQLQKQLSAKNEENEDFSKLVAAAAMQARLAGDWAELGRRSQAAFQRSQSQSRDLL